MAVNAETKKRRETQRASFHILCGPLRLSASVLKVPLAIVLSLLFHFVVAWGLSWGLSGISVDQETVDTLAQLDLSSVDLSFSEQETESAPPQAAAPAAPLAEAPPPPPPTVDPFEPPPMEHLPDEPNAAIQLAQRSDDFHSELTPPDVTPPEFPEPPHETPSPVPQPSTPITPAPQQAHVDAPPSPRRTIKPKYPEGARRRHEEGAVTLELSVDANGAVVGVEVVEPGLFAELRDAAVKAVRAARFKPATADGKPIPAKARLTLNFRLKE